MMVSRVDTAPHRVKTPTPLAAKPQSGFVEPRPPGGDKVPSSDEKFFLTATTPTNRGQKGGPPGRYRLPRCGNRNLGFVGPAPPGEDKGPIPGS